MADKIAVFIGSLRRESYSRRMAKALIALAPPALELEIVEIGGLSLYNQDDDDEGRPPLAWTEFRNRVKTFDGLLFVTPEYNRSVPAALKNALDVGSRPFGRSAWEGKPGAVLSISPGAIGGFGANHHLRQCLVFLDVPTMPQPEAYIGGAAKLFEADGTIASPSTRDFLASFMEKFAAWVRKYPASR